MKRQPNRKISSKRRHPQSHIVVLHRDALLAREHEKNEDYQKASRGSDRRALDVDFNRKNALSTLNTAGLSSVGVTVAEISDAIDAEIAQPGLRKVMKSLGGQNAEAEATVLAYTQIEYEDSLGNRQPTRWRNKLTTSLFTPHSDHLSLNVVQYYFTLQVSPQQVENAPALEFKPESEEKFYAFSAQTHTLVPITEEVNFRLEKILSNYDAILKPHGYLKHLVSLKHAFLAATKHSEKYYLALKIKQFENQYQWVMSESLKQKELHYRLSQLMVKTRNLERKMRALQKEQAAQPMPATQESVAALQALREQHQEKRGKIDSIRTALHAIADKFQQENARLLYRAHAQVLQMGYLPALTVQNAATVTEENQTPRYTLTQAFVTCHAPELKMTEPFLAENQAPAVEDPAAQQAYQLAMAAAAQHDKAWQSGVKKAQQELQDEAFNDRELRYRSERSALDPKALTLVSTLTRQVEYEEMQARMRALYETAEREREAGLRGVPQKSPTLLARLLLVLRQWFTRWRQPAAGKGQQVAAAAGGAVEVEIKHYVPKPLPYRKKRTKLVGYSQSVEIKQDNALSLGHTQSPRSK